METKQGRKEAQVLLPGTCERWLVNTSLRQKLDAPRRRQHSSSTPQRPPAVFSVVPRRAPCVSRVLLRLRVRRVLAVQSGALSDPACMQRPVSTILSSCLAFHCLVLSVLAVSLPSRGRWRRRRSVRRMPSSPEPGFPSTTGCWTSASAGGGSPSGQGCCACLVCEC